jgi:hypothetical protein
MSGKVGRKKQLKTVLKEKGLEEIQFIFKKWLKRNNQIILFGDDEKDKLHLIDPKEIIDLEGGMIFIISDDCSADFILDTSMSVDKL